MNNSRPDILWKLLAIHVHLFHINILPSCCLPFINATTDNVDIIPQHLKHYYLPPTLLQLFEVRNIHLKQRCRFQQSTHLFLHSLDLLMILNTHKKHTHDRIGYKVHQTLICASLFIIPGFILARKIQLHDFKNNFKNQIANCKNSRIFLSAKGLHKTATCLINRTISWSVTSYKVWVWMIWGIIWGNEKEALNYAPIKLICGMSRNFHVLLFYRTSMNPLILYLHKVIYLSNQ